MALSIRMFVLRRSFLLSFFWRKRAGMQFSFIFIALILQFHNAFATPMDGWQLIDVVRAASIPDQSYGKGYECGNDFFSDSEIKGVLSKYYQYVNLNLHSLLAFNSQEYSNVPQEYQNIQQHITPQPYQGLLYNGLVSSNYILLPIQKEKMGYSPSKYPSDSYYIVINKNTGGVVDVISSTINNSHTKCIKTDGLTTRLPISFPEKNNGFYCAHEFLSDDLIQKSLRLARDIVGKSNLYPMRYVGRLYPANSDYLIWPIFSRDGLFDYNSVVAGPYFLVIDVLGNLIETVVQGHSNNFLRCTRSRISSKRPKSNVPNDLSVPAPDMQSGRPASNVPNHLPAPAPDMEYGYFCDRVFFSDKTVKEAAKAARHSKKSKIQSRFPSRYDGPPFLEPLLLWPLLKNGHKFIRGPPGFFRVVLTKNFKLKSVAITQKSEIQLCKEGMKKKEKHHEKSDYFCLDHIVYSRRLQIAAEIGCNIFNERQDTLFPAIYEGPSFDKSGSYFTFPVPRNAEFENEPGTDRVVMNSQCEVVGALTTLQFEVDGRPSKRLVLCIKLQESSSEKTYIEPDMPIIEYSRKNKTH